MNKYVKKENKSSLQLGGNGSTRDSGYAGLANAIVLQALSDYSTALIRLATNNYTCSEGDYSQSKCESLLYDSKKFLQSQYFNLLTELDGQFLIDLMTDRVCKKVRKTRSELPIS